MICSIIRSFSPIYILFKVKISLTGILLPVLL
nr:MAG TPA: hypothetical protein [Caudoviricetes sp.]